jgi:two-component system, OmpR family, sensor histidine kinase KdpD
MAGLGASRRGLWVRILFPAVLLPGAVTALAALPFRVSSTSAALAFVLAVTGAAAAGGAIAGLAASVLSFLALNFFFTPPVGTFSVRKTEDLVALVVFMVVSAVVGTLVSRAIVQRTRAERREREARLLQHLGARLLSGNPPEAVMQSFGRAAIDLFELARYEVVMGQPERITVELGERAKADLAREEFPLSVPDGPVGVIRAYLHPDRPGLGTGERQLIRSFAAQMALAIEGSRLVEVARRAQVDAERSRLQAALLQSVTHDLRTPLASITASVTGLLDKGARFSPQDHRELLETIRQEAERLNRLVGNLLDVSRIRAGALTPSRRLTAIDEVIEGVLARMEPMLRSHHLNVVLREDLPEVPIDVVQIDQALTNILENAAKFSDPGSQISVSAARWEQWVQVRIADQGSGIDPELRPRIFEPFARGEGQDGGTGLGLAIAHAVITAHDGQIRVEDAPGGGTAVVLRLPVRDGS